jgi:CTP:molybdopterin cytidylyltransferase MocA
VLARHAGAIVVVPTDDRGVLVDIDTAEDLRKAERAG